jgi:PPP family 3-phenylpropionic acid transporter
MSRVRLPGIDRTLVYPKLFYLVRFLAGSFIGPFLPLYFREIGLSGQQIGMLGGVRPIVSLLSGPFWSGLSDATRRHRMLLIISLGSTLVLVPAMTLSSNVLILTALVMAHTFMSAPSGPLVDAAVLRVLGGRRNLYGQQRLWGTIGYAIGGVIIGSLMERHGLKVGFYGFFPLTLVVLFVALRMPAAEYRRSTPFWRGLRILTTNRQFAIFLIAVFIAGIGRSGCGRFLFIHLSDLGAPPSLLGLSMLAEGVGEVPVFFLSNRMMRRWRTRTLLIFGWTVYALRLYVLSIMKTPLLFLPVQVVLGIAFSAMVSVGVTLTSELAPEGMEATAQAVYGAMNMGLAGAAGAFLGGSIYDRWGGPALYQFGGTAIAAALLFFIIADRSVGSAAEVTTVS